MIDLLLHSRLAGLIDKVERGEPVDFEKLATLQALDIGMIGQIYAAETMQREAEADELLKDQLEAMYGLSGIGGTDAKESET